MALAEGFEPPSLFVRSEVSCPFERREQTKQKWHREEATIPQPSESESDALPIELSRYGAGRPGVEPGTGGIKIHCSAC
jgi:hypothetical protein